MNITVEPLRQEHLVSSFLDDIRREDYAEWFAGTGLPFEVAIQPTLGEGLHSRIALDDDGVGLMAWGLDRTSESGSTNVWMFATERAARRAVSLHRKLLPEFLLMRSMRPYLHAWSYAKNPAHHRWLEWLGFVFQREAGLEPFGLPFKLYTYGDPACA